MIPEIGHYSLIVAFMLAILQSILPLIGASYRDINLMNSSRYTAISQFIFIAIGFFCLAYALISNDFSVTYVAQNSNSHLPVLYRFCALWGAHEGSLLLWVFILSIWMLMVSLCSKDLPLELLARVLAILGMISVGFLLFLLHTSNPFARLLPNIPLDGRDLNPLLQDPGLAIHPPLLYMGYVGFSVAFAFALAALLSGRIDVTWARFSRPWTLIAWCFLTAGIILGSWWAYRVLGWGGWWFWDPVENASFLPWLVGTALIHSLMVAEQRNTFKGWTILLAIFAFSLSLIGTFLVRSGILVSVHAFAVDPLRGAFMLKFLSIVIGSSLILYAWQAPKIKNVQGFQIWSRETMLLTNNMLLTMAMVTVLLGTLYPLVMDILGLGKLSVGAPYFNSVFIPIVMPLLFLMGFGPLFRWQQSDPIKIMHQLRYTLLAALLLALALPWILTSKVNYIVMLFLALAFWIVLATLQDSFYRSKVQQRFSFARLGMILAHLGFAITIVGIVVTSSYSIQRDVRMTTGDVVNAGPYQFHLLSVQQIKGPNYSGDEAKIIVTKSNRDITILKPQLRVYTVQNTAMTKTAIHANPLRDLYVALGEPLESGAWSVRIYYKPFVRWIWFGGLMMIGGGIWAAMNRRNLAKKNAEEE